MSPIHNPIAFIEFALTESVLKFGEFTLKSGRLSPYFFNLGNVDSGSAMSQLGRFYADFIVANDLVPDVLFGPAYKGIPLATAVAIALADRHGLDVGVSFNRKEAKDHGEGGTIVGASLAGTVLVVDDVISAGTSARESLALIRAAGARPRGLVVALDRQEVATGTDVSAATAIAAEFKAPARALIDLDALFTFLKGNPDLGAHLPAIEAYRARYAR